MQLHGSVRWLLPALLLSALPSLSLAESFHGIGFALHMLPAFGQAATPADAAPEAQPQAPVKPIANRKHLNLSVGPVKMHVPVSGKRPVTPVAPANGNAGEAPPGFVHAVQQPLGQPAFVGQVQTAPGGSGPATPARIDAGIASGGVQRQAPPGAAIKANTPIITKDVGDEETRIQNPVLDGHFMKANQPIITKDVSDRGRINPTVKEGRSAAAPGSGTGNPQQGQQRDIINKGLPITNKNIESTEPKVTGTGTGVKPGAPAIYDHGGYTHVEQGGTMTGIQERPTPQQPGQERDIINKGLPITNKNIEPTNRSVTGTLNTWPQKQAAVRTEPGGSAQAQANPANQRNADAPLNQNGKAGAHEIIGVPIQGTEVGLEHNPGGMVTQGAMNGSSGSKPRILIVNNTSGKQRSPNETVTPISGTPVILQHEPEGMATHGATPATTDKLQGPQGAGVQMQPSRSSAQIQPRPAPQAQPRPTPAARPAPAAQGGHEHK